MYILRYMYANNIAAYSCKPEIIAETTEPQSEALITSQPTISHLGDSPKRDLEEVEEWSASREDLHAAAPLCGEQPDEVWLVGVSPPGVPGMSY